MSLPIADTPQGGIENSFRGETVGQIAGFGTGAQSANPFAGMGPLLEDADEKVFKSLDGLVLRQDLIARNRLAIDTNWTYVKLGFPWTTLTKDQNRDVYEQTLPYGSTQTSIQAVPNKCWDLINKTTQALLQDFPQADAEPQTDAEQAQAACQMANRFLAQDAAEQGTNDAQLYHDRVEKALTCSTSYVEYWVDPVGGGYVPLQIKAHPQAVSPQNPLVGPNGEPTTDPVDRYVTSAGPEGQFTNDPSQAAPQWQPKIRVSKWEREHVRTFPESVPVELAEKVIILGYCTLGEAKRRWKSVAAMSPPELDVLCDWTPARYLCLLPPFQRARWRLTDGRDKAKAGASDERIMFYYHCYVKASPTYVRGADVVVTGARDGFVIDRALLSAELEVTTPNGAGSEIRCMEIPMVQVTPRGDPDERDPTGRAYIELFAGAAESNAFMAMSFAQLIDTILHPDKYIPSTSPVEGWQVDDSRATGGFVQILTPADKPIYGDQPQLPNSFFNMYELSDEAINSIASSERAASGADNSKERSGKAIQIAVAQNNVSLGGMNTSVNNAYARGCRIKIELCMAKFSTSQQIGYVGEDGAYKQDAWKGVDFAQVGRVVIKAGSGTMMTPDAKVQYLGNLQAAGMIGREEAADAARESYSLRLGLPPDPSMQRIERQVSSWEKGPPSPEWVMQAQSYAQAKAVADQQNAQSQAMFQQAHAAQSQDAANATTLKMPHMAQPLRPPPQAVPMDAMGQPMPAPWTPFAPLPMDDEPQIAAMRQRRLVRLMNTAQFTAQPIEWQQTVFEAYSIARNAVAAAQPPAQLPKGVSIGVQADAGTVAQAEHAATHPNAPQNPPKPQMVA